MKRDNNILIAALLFCLMMAGCTSDESMTETGYAEGDPVGQPVLFSAGNVGETQAVTRAGVPYMALNGRFVCTMYYHPKAGDTDESDFDISEGGTMSTAWLQVSDPTCNPAVNPLGNSVYRKKDFTAPSDKDGFGFDRNATIFFWQNRLTHAFLALADYNQLDSNVGATTATGSQGKLKMFPNGEKVTGTDAETSMPIVDPKVNVYDLTRGGRTSITQQPDPIMALTVMKPAGATQESNRVRLYFKHQFSQIQVNIKGADDNSADITAGQILKVELLGVSTEGYVVNNLNPKGTVGNVAESDAPGTMNAADAKEVHLDDFTDEQLSVNRWGTSFEMFDMATGVIEDGHDKGYAIGFVKSYNAIAFGKLWAIRITWREKTAGETEEEINNAIRHVTTFEVPVANDSGDPLQDLHSGMRYIYDLELRRGTLAVIRTQILDWLQKEELVYGTEGTITN